MSDAVSAGVPANLGQGIKAPTPAAVQATSGKNLPQSGSAAHAASPIASPATHAAAVNRNATVVVQKPTATNHASVPALVQQLNKYINDSGRANQFRVDPASPNQTIQEINPSNGEVIGEFSVSEFPALARSLGVSGVLVDDHT